MTMLPEKPSLEEMLSHHGIKGQKWGVRKKKVTTQEIHGARHRQQTRVNSFMDAHGKATDPNISAKARAAAKLKADKIEREHDSSEDRVTAHRMTKGEHALLGLGIVLTGPAAPLVAVGAIGGKSIANVIVKKSVDKSRAKA